MTQKNAQSYDILHLFLIQVQVLNVHEVRNLETKLEKLGVILYDGYLRGADDWHRPTIRSACYIVAVKADRVQALKASLRLLDREMASSISYRPL